MKKILAIIFLTALLVNAQSYNRKPWGFGIVVGDPTGLTVKYWSTSENAFVFDVGASYFGSPRLNVDYLWHFNAFQSNIVGLYAGPGAALGFGESKGIYYGDKKDGYYVRDRGEIGIGVRGVFGLNVIPRQTPLEIFLEFGLLVGMVPAFGSSADLAVGVRFYP